MITSSALLLCSTFFLSWQVTSLLSLNCREPFTKCRPFNTFSFKWDFAWCVCFTAGNGGAMYNELSYALPDVIVECVEQFIDDFDFLNTYSGES